MDTVPTELEIKRQLRRMLDGERFCANENPAKFLNVIVGLALKGQSIKQSSIGEMLFPGRDLQQDTSVRTTASNLRKVLDAYYSQEGSEDVVIISVPRTTRAKGTKRPPGESYRPIFVYNPRSKSIAEYRRGLRLMSSLSPDDVDSAATCFGLAMQHDPNSARFLSAGAEALLRLRCLLRVQNKPDYQFGDWEGIEGVIDAALELDTQDWRSNLVLGCIRFCQRRWNEATLSFDRALELEPHQTRNHGWYQAYRFASGHQEEALESARAVAEEHPEDLQALLVLALFLYLARRYENADLILSQAWYMRPDHWLTQILSGLVRLGLTKPHLALRCFRDADTKSQEKPQITGLCIVAEAHYARSVGGTPWHVDLGQEILSDPIQLAVAYLALDRIEDAIDAIEKAVKRHDPLITMLHLWPLLDSLRENPEYKRLIGRDGLPI